MHVEHRPVVFVCDDRQLLGIIEDPDESLGVGVLIVTGGPQYRVGSHRQFVLIARAFAAMGIPTMRFDYRGMGDTGGESIAFDNVSSDIKSALDCFVATCHVENIVLWGLCDAASACMIYGLRDDRVVSMILLNPWVRTEAGLAKAYVQHYYLRRLMSVNFWRKLFSGRLSMAKAIRELLDNLSRFTLGEETPESRPLGKEHQLAKADFCQRMLEGFREFSRPVLFLMSTDDLTAAEFASFVKASKDWSRLMNRKNVTRVPLKGMDHTFSRTEWRQEVVDICVKWILSLSSRQELRPHTGSAQAR